MSHGDLHNAILYTMLYCINLRGTPSIHYDNSESSSLLSALFFSYVDSNIYICIHILIVNYDNGQRLFMFHSIILYYMTTIGFYFLFYFGRSFRNVWEKKIVISILFKRRQMYRHHSLPLLKDLPVGVDTDSCWINSWFSISSLKHKAWVSFFSFVWQKWQFDV